jgi:hypothetical protein
VHGNQACLACLLSVHVAVQQGWHKACKEGCGWQIRLLFLSNSTGVI